MMQMIPRGKTLEIGNITHFTLEEGGEWRSIGEDRTDNWRKCAFAVRFESGDIWDPIAGWREPLPESYFRKQ